MLERKKPYKMEVTFLPRGRYPTGWVNDALIIYDSGDEKILATFVKQTEPTIAASTNAGSVIK